MRRLTLSAALLGLAATLSPAQAGLPPNWEESGQASWYGPGFTGRRTSSGETFDHRAMTAAHDSLPLGTRVLVTTQETGRSTVVTITDRLPTKRTRIIDVSQAAAAKLGIIGSGLGMVTISPAPIEAPVEVAEAMDGDEDPAISPRLHGPRRMHPGVRKVSTRR